MKPPPHIKLSICKGAFFPFLNLLWLSFTKRKKKKGQNNIEDFIFHLKKIPGIETDVHQKQYTTGHHKMHVSCGNKH